MTVKDTSPQDLSTGNDQNKLLEFIKKYRTHVGDHKDYVDMSCEVLEAGGQTEFTQEMNSLLADPIKALIGLKERADNELFSLVDGLCRLFMKTAKEKELIDWAFRTKDNKTEVCYGIVLRNDDFVSRDSIFAFLNLYSSLELAEIIPVHFQFVPSTLLGNLSNKEIIA